MDEFLLIESKTLRNKLCTENAAVTLNRVGQLECLPQSGYATTESLAEFYEVSTKTIEKLIERHKEEFSLDGYKVLYAKEFRDRHGVGLKSKARFIAVYPRKACKLLRQNWSWE